MEIKTMIVLVVIQINFELLTAEHAYVKKDIMITMRIIWNVFLAITHGTN